MPSFMNWALRLIHTIEADICIRKREDWLDGVSETGVQRCFYTDNRQQKIWAGRPHRRDLTKHDARECGMDPGQKKLAQNLLEREHGFFDIWMRAA